MSKVNLIVKTEDGTIYVKNIPKSEINDELFNIDQIYKIEDYETCEAIKN